MNVLIVHKRARIADLSDDERAGLASSNPEALARLIAAHERNEQSIACTVKHFEAHGLSLTVLSRDEFCGVPEDTDLVVAVGGDGTVLDVSHQIVDEPLIGVNSDPIRSVGYFCATDAEGLIELVPRWLAGQVDTFELHRIALEVDGIREMIPCMNDLLITQQNPAMMTRYIVHAGARAEEQWSSGMWVSTPAGSTGGIRSAGGTVMPLEGGLVQYFVREPFQRQGMNYELLRGVRHLREGLSIQSLMNEGRIYIDGPYISLPFPLGSMLRIMEGPTLKLLGLHPSLRER